MELNPHAWNKIANMVFIEQPVGVGFSTTSESIAYGDEQAAADNHRFIVGFLQRFSSFNSTDFFITSESYGGHYLPTLAREIMKRGDIPNFKGFAVGNPLTFMPYRNFGQYGTAYGHQLLPKPLWDSYIKAGCKDAWPAPPSCGNLTEKMDQLLSGFDAYALDFPVCSSSSLAAGRLERFMLMRAIRAANARSAGSANPKGSVAGYFPDDYEPCAENWETTYLNRADVRKAIHADGIPLSTPWSMCSDSVSQAYNGTDVNQPMMPIYKYLISQKGLRLMVYSGDDDSVCATLGSQQWIWDLGLKVLEPWTPWKVEGQVAGFVTQFDGLTFVTAHGAGHMVPATRPAQSLQLMRNFLSDSW